MLCPTCKTPLTMSERQGIEIDYCPTCRGVWLDRGELDKIIERSAGSQPAQTATTPPPPPAPQQFQQQPDYGMPQQGYQQQGYQQHGYHKPHHKRRKSFLEELFD